MYRTAQYRTVRYGTVRYGTSQTLYPKPYIKYDDNGDVIDENMVLLMLMMLSVIDNDDIYIYIYTSYYINPEVTDNYVCLFVSLSVCA